MKNEYVPLVLIALLLVSSASTYLVVIPTLEKLFSNPSPSPTMQPTNQPTATVQVRPKLKVFSVLSLNCTECSGTAGVIAQLESAGSDFNNTNIEYTSLLGKELVQNYNLTKIPSVVISGEINLPSINYTLSTIGNVTKDAVIFDSPEPVYLDLKTGKKVGIVQVTYLSTKYCKECSDFSNLLDLLRQSGIYIDTNENSVVPSETAAGKALVKQYNLTRLPGLILSNDAGAYREFEKAWAEIGNVEYDGSFVLKDNLPPYFDIVKNKTIGLVNVTFLLDQSCPQCYNVSVHDDVLTRYQISVKNRTGIDVSTKAGLALVKLYNVTAVPTVILSSDASAYENFATKIWPQVGSFEKDGSLVFRNMDALDKPVYRNLNTSKIMNLPANATNSTA